MGRNSGTIRPRGALLSRGLVLFTAGGLVASVFAVAVVFGVLDRPTLTETTLVVVASLVVAVALGADAAALWLLRSSSAVRDGRTAVVATGWSLAAGFSLLSVLPVTGLAGEGRVDPFTVVAALFFAASGLLLATASWSGRFLGLVVRHRAVVTAVCLLPVVVAVACVVAGVAPKAAAPPVVVVAFGVVTAAVAAFSAVRSARLARASRAPLHSWMALGAGLLTVAAGVYVVAVAQAIDGTSPVTIPGKGGWAPMVIAAVAAAATLGRLAVEYAQGRRIAMAIEGIFEWSPDDEFTEHLNEAAEALLASVEDFGDEELSHTNRVIEFSIGIGKELDLPPGRLRVISLGALFHDVGTITIPEEILNKPGALTEAERQLVRDHAERGWAMANRSQALWEAALAIRHHHEWVDGSGYPDGLAGEDIPIEARVIAVADMFDALLTPRPYRDALTESEALTLMRAECGTHLDRDCYHAFARYLQRRNDNVVAFDRVATRR